MFKKTLLMSLSRQCFCLFVVGVLLIGQLSTCPCSLISFSVVKLNSAAFNTPQSECFVGVVDMDDSPGFLPVVVPEVSLVVSTELPLQNLPPLLLFSAAGFSSLPFVRPPPLVSPC